MTSSANVNASGANNAHMVPMSFMNAFSLASTGARDGGSSSLFSPQFPFCSLREESAVIAIDETAEAEADAEAQEPSSARVTYSLPELPGLLGGHSGGSGGGGGDGGDGASGAAVIVTVDTCTSDEGVFSPAGSDVFGISVSPPSANAPSSSDDTAAAAAATAAACASISGSAAALTSGGAGGLPPPDYAACVDDNVLGAGMCEVSDDSLLDAFFDLEVMPATRSRSTAHTRSGSDASRHARHSAVAQPDARASSRTTVTLQ